MTYQLHPRLVEPLHYTRAGRRIDIRVGRDAFGIDFDSEPLAQGACVMLDALRRGELDEPALAGRFDLALAPYGAAGFLAVLDEHQLLTDVAPAEGAITGRQFFCEVTAYYRNELLPRYPEDEFSARVRAHQVDAQALRRWSLEYHAVTRMAERCLAPALCHLRGDELLAGRLRDFFLDEVGHEKLLRRSLHGFGLKDADIDALTQHLATDAMMAMLLRAAHFDLPLFVALVGQMEGTRQESLDYMATLDNGGLPGESVRNQKIHENINVKHNHGDEARQLAAALPVVQHADIERCQRELHLFLMVRRSLTPWIMGAPRRYAALTTGALREVIARWLPQWLHETLPIAIARADEIDARPLVQRLVEGRYHASRRIDPDQTEDLAMTMIGMSLWKSAYQAPTEYAATLAWLEDIASGEANPLDAGCDVSAVVRSFVQQPEGQA